MRKPETTQTITAKMLDDLVSTTQTQVADAGVAVAQADNLWMKCPADDNLANRVDAENHYRALRNVLGILAQARHDYNQTIGGR